MAISIFGWGTNGCGELGLGKSSEQEETPCVVDFEGAEGVCFASAGGSHTALLVSQCVYTCGNNDKGQLGRRTEGKIDSTLKRVELQGRFQQVAAGWEFTLAKTDAGEVWCWGSNQFGQLGSADKVHYIPVQLQLGKTVEFIAAGTRFSVLITDEGRFIEVYGKVTRGSGNNTNHLILECPLGRRFKSVACGINHFYALDNNGAVWTYGCNKFGQRGTTNEEKALTELKLNLADGESVIQVGSGWSFGGVLTDRGNVYTWGRNTYGQLGRETDGAVSYEPRLVEKVDDVKILAIGSEHAVVLTGTGQVRTWGWNEHGNCGNGKTEDIIVPENILFFHHKKVIALWAGHGHNFAISREEQKAYLIDIIHRGYAVDETTHFRANASCTIIRGPKIVIVDTMTPWDGPFILRELQKLNIRPDEVDYVISTHGHSDHIGNNNLFLKAIHIVGYCVSKKDTYWFHPFDSGDIFEREEDIEDQTIWRSAGSTDPQRQERSRLQLAELADYIIPGHGPMFKVTERMRNILRIQVDS
ncbi:uncharacterized protein LOC136037415 isoform X2 [Artemia franciscana]|uniref:uncharacterized protein LOC136037415 isoform X2 n=1 Tax=Artemia franciscana TaxID=6661 RepID=UPI0032DAF1F2